MRKQVLYHHYVLYAVIIPVEVRQNLLDRVFPVQEPLVYKRGNDGGRESLGHGSYVEQGGWSDRRFLSVLFYRQPFLLDPEASGEDDSVPVYDRY